MKCKHVNSCYSPVRQADYDFQNIYTSFYSRFEILYQTTRTKDATLNMHTSTICCMLFGVISILNICILQILHSHSFNIQSMHWNRSLLGEFERLKMTGMNKITAGGPACFNSKTYFELTFKEMPFPDDKDVEIKMKLMLRLEDGGIEEFTFTLHKNDGCWESNDSNPKVTIVTFPPRDASSLKMLIQVGIGETPSINLRIKKISVWRESDEQMLHS